ncbi:hypothetical protein THAOC_29784, partial [Thalassiosira oceanica]
MLGRLFLSKSALLRWPTVAGRGARGGATAATVSPAYPWSTSLPPGGQWTEPDGTSLLGNATARSSLVVSDWIHGPTPIREPPSLLPPPCPPWGWGMDVSLSERLGAALHGVSPALRRADGGDHRRSKGADWPRPPAPRPQFKRGGLRSWASEGSYIASSALWGRGSWKHLAVNQALHDAGDSQLDGDSSRLQAAAAPPSVPARRGEPMHNLHNRISSHGYHAGVIHPRHREAPAFSGSKDQARSIGNHFQTVCPGSVLPSNPVPGLV